MTTRNEFSFAIRHRNGWGSGFGPRPTHCAECGAEIPPQAADPCATGYGCENEETLRPSHLRAFQRLYGALPVLKKGETLTRSRAICYPCCAALDLQRMRETGRATLYFAPEKESSDGFNARVTNWPGSLTIRGRYSKGRHNIAGARYDVWFTGPDGTAWHGVNIGDNQILRCKRLKARRP